MAMSDNSNSFSFTEPRLRALSKAQAGKRDTYYDEKEPELCLRVTDKGAKSFCIYKKYNGRPKRLTLGSFPAMSVEDARKAVRRALSKLAEGVDIFREAAAVKEELTLGQLFDEYIKRHASKKRKTWDVMQKDFERNLEHWRNRLAFEITADAVEHLHGKLAKDRGPYTANRTIQLLRAIFNKASKWKLFSHDNPASGISLFEEKARERFLSADEVRRLFEKLGGLPIGEDIGDFIRLCLLTGARKSNILSMRWKDIDEQACTWTIEETKNGSSQTLPLTGAEIVLLQQRREILNAKFRKLPEYVFPTRVRGKIGHMVDLKKSWDRLRQKAGIPDCTIHDLRRNLGSWMASGNVNVALIKSALNHKDMKTTLAVYARTATDAVRESRELGHNLMLEAAGLKQLQMNNVVNLAKSK